MVWCSSVYSASSCLLTNAGLQSFLVPSLVVDLPTLLECPLNMGAVYMLCFGLLAPSLLAVTSQGYHCFALGGGLRPEKRVIIIIHHHLTQFLHSKLDRANYAP